VEGCACIAGHGQPSVQIKEGRVRAAGACELHPVEPED